VEIFQHSPKDKYSLYRNEGKVIKYLPLNKEEIYNVIHGIKKASRVPVILQFWTHSDNFEKQKQQYVLDIMKDYPQDVIIIGADIPNVFDGRSDEKEYRWVNYEQNFDEKLGLDERVAINNWSLLDGIINNFPNANYSKMFSFNPENDGRYRLLYWWFCLFERHWQLRGMTNALTDYYEYPNEVHRLYRAITDFYLRIIERAKYEVSADGIFTSDDLGTQKSQFFSQEIFDEFFKPYYKEISDKIHSLNMDFWLHACGCIEKFLPSFIEIGLDVIHPIQKYTMDEKRIAQLYGDKICIWAGFDVQRIIPYGTCEDVRNEVRYLFDTYNRKNGRFMFTAGNGINGDCPLDSLKALYEESFFYKNK